MLRPVCRPASCCSIYCFNSSYFKLWLSLSTAWYFSLRSVSPSHFLSICWLFCSNFWLIVLSVFSLVSLEVMSDLCFWFSLFSDDTYFMSFAFLSTLSLTWSLRFKTSLSFEETRRSNYETLDSSSRASLPVLRFSASALWSCTSLAFFSSSASLYLERYSSRSAEALRISLLNSSNVSSNF